MVVEEVEEPLGGEGPGQRLAVPGGSFGLGEADELVLTREHVVQALGLAGRRSSESYIPVPVSKKGRLGKTVQASMAAVGQLRWLWG